MNSEAKIMNTLRSNNSFITSPEPVNLSSSKSPTPSPCTIAPSFAYKNTDKRSAELVTPTLTFDITANASSSTLTKEPDNPKIQSPERRGSPPYKEISKIPTTSNQPTKITSASKSWIGSDMISKITKSKSSALKQAKKLLAEKEETIQSQNKEIHYLRNELEKCRRLLKTKDAKLSQMEDILKLKRTEVETNLLVEAAEKEDLEKAEKKKKMEKQQNTLSVVEETTKRKSTLTSSGIECNLPSTPKNNKSDKNHIQNAKTDNNNNDSRSPTTSPMGSPTLNSDNLKNPEVKLRRQRQGISAAPVKNPKEIQLPKRNSKIYIDNDTIDMLCSAFLSNEFLSMLDDDNIKMMAQCVQGPLKIPMGTKIIREGEPGDGLFVLETGTVEVSKNNKIIRSIQANPGKGIVFGELAILYNCQRTASIQALSECKVWYLDRNSFQAISIESGQKKIKEIKDFLKKVKLFKNFPERKLVKLIDAFEVEEFERDTFIIRQNSSGETFYIIADGKVDITVDGNFIRNLGRGDYFGEKALLEKHSHRTANVIVTSKTVSCLCLERDDFLRLIGPMAQKNYSIAGIGSGNEDNRLSIVSSIGSPTDNLDFDERGRPISHRFSRISSQFELTPESPGDRNSKCNFQMGALSTQTQKLSPNTSGASNSNNIIRSPVPRQSSRNYRDTDFADLEYITTIGVGGFGRVELVRIVNDKIALALKRIKKSHVKELKQEQHVVNERNILLQCRSPFIIKLYRTFRDRKYVYLLSEACLGGELWTLLRTKSYFNDSWARFFTGCAVEALAYLHARGVVYAVSGFKLLCLKSGFVFS